MALGSIVGDLVADIAEKAAERGKGRKNSSRSERDSQLRPNASLCEANTRLIDQGKDLRAQVTKLQARNKSLQRTINQIQDLTEADDDPDDLLQDIQDVIGRGRRR